MISGLPTSLGNCWESSNTGVTDESMEDGSVADAFAAGGGITNVLGGVGLGGLTLGIGRALIRA